jgi:hypothetical protein
MPNLIIAARKLESLIGFRFDVVGRVTVYCLSCSAQERMIALLARKGYRMSECFVQQDKEIKIKMEGYKQR